MPTKSELGLFTKLFPRKYRTLVALIITVLVIAGSFLITQFTPNPLATFDPGTISQTAYQVIDVVDGDTFKLNIGGKTDTVRIIGIDTPETVDPRKPVQCFGKEASNKLKDLLVGKSVYVASDPTQDKRDKYDRLLLYVWVSQSDGTRLFVNKEMILQGFAHEYTYNTPYQYQSEFKQVEQEAKDSSRGLWGNCPAN